MMTSNIDRPVVTLKWLIGSRRTCVLGRSPIQVKCTVMQEGFRTDADRSALPQFETLGRVSSFTGGVDAEGRPGHLPRHADIDSGNGRCQPRRVFQDADSGEGLIRNSGSNFCEYRGATTTIVAGDAEG